MVALYHVQSDVDCIWTRSLNFSVERLLKVVMRVVLREERVFVFKLNRESSVLTKKLFAF